MTHEQRDAIVAAAIEYAETVLQWERAESYMRARCVADGYLEYAEGAALRDEARARHERAEIRLLEAVIAAGGEEP